MDDDLLQQLPAIPCAACPNPACVHWMRALDDDGNVEAVYACVAHSISLDAAAQTHAVGCTAPAPGTPTPCCTPLAPPDPGPDPGPLNPLPPGWT